MRLKFETLFRGFILGFVLIFVVLLLWGTLATAQENNATNGIAAVEKAHKASLINIPAVLEKDDPILTFGLDHIHFLKADFIGGQPRWKFVASLIYIILAFYVSKFFDYLTRVWLKRFAEKTETKLDDLLLELLNGPVKIVSFITFLNIGLSIFSWPPLIENIIARGLDLFVVGVFVYVLVKAVDMSVAYWEVRATGEKTFDEQLFPIIRKSLKVFICIVAFLYVCDNVFHKDIKAIITSLSIGGLALGLAAQDTLSNFFGAVVVFIDKPFRIGDRIQLPDVDGIVESIGIRSTRVRNLDGHLITVPNKTMGNAVITNITRRPNIKTTMNLRITYDTSAQQLERAVKILTETFKPHPMTHDLIISFNQFHENALNILVVHWWGSTDYRAYLNGMQEMNLQIKQRFDAEGINFAFPGRTVYLKQDSEWKVISEPPEIEPLLLAQRD